MEKQHTYTVSGIWPFPLDMLRHDHSHAATDADEAAIARYSMEHAPDFETVAITLTGPCKPNTARWESFGWSIPADTEYEALKRRKAEEREREALRQSALAKLTPAERRALEIEE